MMQDCEIDLMNIFNFNVDWRKLTIQMWAEHKIFKCERDGDMIHTQWLIDEMTQLKEFLEKGTLNFGHFYSLINFVYHNHSRLQIA